MSAMLKLEMSAGTSIERACEDAQRVSDLLRVDVEFSFNEVRCLAGIGGHWQVLVEAWCREISRERDGPLDRKFAHSVDRKRQLAIAQQIAHD